MKPPPFLLLALPSASAACPAVHGQSSIVHSATIYVADKAPAAHVESSLFVYPGKFVLKTCGTTQLLNAVPLLLELAASLGCQAVRCKYSRASFLFPEYQVRCSSGPATWLVAISATCSYCIALPAAPGPYLPGIRGSYAHRASPGLLRACAPSGQCTVLFCARMDLTRLCACSPSCTTTLPRRRRTWTSTLPHWAAAPTCWATLPMGCSGTSTWPAPLAPSSPPAAWRSA